MPITTKGVSSNPALASPRCNRYYTVVFFGYSGYLHKKTDRHDITKILLNVASNTMMQILILSFIHHINI